MAGAVRRQPTTAARRGESAFERHQRMVAEAVSFYGEHAPDAPQPRPVKTDQDVLRDSYRFIREEADDAAGGWEVRLARHYYSKLFREYCIADLSRYKEGKVGLRWRTQAEVVSGKGQFRCGAKGCEERGGLASFEVNLRYQEAGARKNALVKLRLCPAHGLQLNYKKNAEVLKEQQKRKLKEAKRAAKQAKRRKKSGGHLPDSGASPNPSPPPEAKRRKTSGDHLPDGEASPILSPPPQGIPPLSPEREVPARQTGAAEQQRGAAGVRQVVRQAPRSSPPGAGQPSTQQEMDAFLEALLL